MCRTLLEYINTLPTNTLIGIHTPLRNTTEWRVLDKEYNRLTVGRLRNYTLSRVSKVHTPHEIKYHIYIVKNF